MTNISPENTARPFSRSPDAVVDPIFVQRWSSRALSSEPISEEVIRSLFEAARWAPSASNLQPWLFVYASDDESLSRARLLLKDSNRRWASRAPLLIFVFSRKVHPETGQPVRTGAFDTGAAWLSLALQAERVGLKTRAMGGILHEETYAAFGVPKDQFESQAAIAVGYPAAASELPADLAAKDGPSGRKSQRDFVFAGRFETR
jgi:nitroreductase